MSRQLSGHCGLALLTSRLTGFDPLRTSLDGQLCKANDSFSLDVRRLEDRPPFFDFGFVVNCERFRCLLCAWGNLLTEVGEPLPDCWIRMRLDDGTVQFPDDRRGSAFGRP